MKIMHKTGLKFTKFDCSGCRLFKGFVLILGIEIFFYFVMVTITNSFHGFYFTHECSVIMWKYDFSKVCYQFLNEKTKSSEDSTEMKC